MNGLILVFLVVAGVAILLFRNWKRDALVFRLKGQAVGFVSDRVGYEDFERHMLDDRGDRTVMWSTCQRGDMMLWYWGRRAGEPLSKERRSIVAAACECAEFGLPIYLLLHPKDDRPSTWLRTMRRWAAEDNCVTHEQIRHMMAEVQHDAVFSAGRPQLSGVAMAVYYACYAAVSSERENLGKPKEFHVAAADIACYSAAWIGFVAFVHSLYTTPCVLTANAARAEVLRQCADVVRRYRPVPPE